VRGLPALTPDATALSGESLFTPQPRGTALEHFIVQAGQILAKGQAEGGFFIMIGRKPGGEAASEAAPFPARAGLQAARSGDDMHVTHV
jgi:hypothetical protein